MYNPLSLLPPVKRQFTAIYKQWAESSNLYSFHIVIWWQPTWKLCLQNLWLKRDCGLGSGVYQKYGSLKTAWRDISQRPLHITVVACSHLSVSLLKWAAFYGKHVCSEKKIRHKCWSCKQWKSCLPKCFQRPLHIWLLYIQSPVRLCMHGKHVHSENTSSDPTTPANLLVKLLFSILN